MPRGRMHWYLDHATLSQTLEQDKLPSSATVPGRLVAIASLSLPRNRQPLAVVGCLAAGRDRQRLVQPEHYNEGRSKKAAAGGFVPFSICCCVASRPRVDSSLGIVRRAMQGPGMLRLRPGPRLLRRAGAAGLLHLRRVGLVRRWIDHLGREERDAVSVQSLRTRPTVI